MRNRLIRQLSAAILVAGCGLSVSGCVIAPGHGGGWCYWHPYRCR